ncbi:MAG: hypothetical protein LBL49_09495 [Clostridiales Family XIII bacterium]|nr:hypothetical protein [Clostridiales Family XIII bacterium]
MKKRRSFVFAMICLCLIISGCGAPSSQNASGSNGGRTAQNADFEDAVAFYVGGEPVYNSEFNFHVVSAVNSYYESEEGQASGFDPGIPLSEQVYPDSEYTLEDMFRQSVTDDMHYIISMYNEAQADGYEMGDWEKECIKDFFESLDAYAEQEGLTEEEVFISKYGIPMSREGVNKILERGFIGEAYEKYLIDNTKYEDEELEAFYEEHKREVIMADCNTATLRFIYFADRGLAQDVMEKFESGDRSEASFIELVNQYSTDEVDIAAGGLFADLSPENTSVALFDDVESWVFDGARQPGDYSILDVGDGYELAYFVAQGTPLWKKWSRSAKSEEDIQNILAKYPLTYPEQ